MRRSVLQKTISVVLCGVITATVISACSKVEIKKFEVTPTDIELEAGTTADIEVSIKTDPKDADIEIEYSSSDDTVATVDNEGTITGVGSGDCVITVSAGDEEETIDVEVYEVERYHVGDTVSTDMFEFTLISADLSYGAENSNDNNYLTPTSDYTNNPFVADNGDTLVILEIKVKNLNRSSANIAGNSTMDDWCWDWEVEYDGHSYTLYCWNFTSYQTAPVQLGTSAISNNGSNWSVYQSSNDILASGEEVYYRIPTIVSTDISDFSSTFDLVINIPTSDGADTEFIYRINGD